MQIASVAYVPVTPVRPIGPTASPDQQLASLDSLSSVILDETGKYSGSEKLEAYNTSYRLSITGQYRDVGPDGAKLLNQIAGSATAQLVDAERSRYSDAMSAAIQRAGRSGVSHSQALGAAALQHFDDLPKSGQEALFASLNAPNRAGVTPFASIDDWRAQMSAMAGPPAPRAAPTDSVSLSPYAQTIVGDAPAPPPAAAAYTTGSKADIRV